MRKGVTWHGSETEALLLLQALNRHCSCTYGANGARRTTCPPHRILVEDQRVVDGLLFMRRIAARLRSEERCGEPARRAPVSASL